METSLSKIDLKKYMGNQFSNIFPDQYRFEGKDIDAALDIALDRVEYCFKHIQAYCREGQPFFSHLHSDQYSSFLYFFSNSLWNISQNQPICDKTILLNKMLNSLFYSYKCNLPDIFLFVHAVGTVIGNARYSDFLVIMQNVTINTSQDEENSPAPFLGKGVLLGAGCKIIGNQPIGNRVSIGANVVVYQQAIPDDSVAVLSGETGKTIIRPRNKSTCYAQHFFNMQI